VLLPTVVFAQGGEAKEPWQGAYTAEAFAGGVIRNSYCDMVGLVEGSFGGLLAAAAGIMAFGFAAFSNSKHVFTAIMVVGAAFTMSAGISLYFGDLGCSSGAGSDAASKVIRSSTAESSSIGSSFDSDIDSADLF